MTDTMPEQTDTEDWGDVEQSADTYPEYPANPHNHVFTLSYAPDKAPFMVVRANTSAELKAALEELESSGVYTDIGNAYTAFKAQATMGRGLGPASPVQGVPQGPGAPANFANPNGSFAPAAQQQYNQQPAQQFPNQAFPGQPSWQTTGAPQGAFSGGGGNRQGPKPRPTDWPMVYKINVPFQQKDAFKAFREQHKDTLRGKVAWAGGGDYWIHGDVVGGFADYRPMAA